VPTYVALRLDFHAGVVVRWQGPYAPISEGPMEITLTILFFLPVSYPASSKKPPFPSFAGFQPYFYDAEVLGSQELFSELSPAAPPNFRSQLFAGARHCG